MSSIKVSPKYGLNPFIPGCFWCGGAKDMLAIPGKLKGDAEARHGMIIDTEPCDKCAEGFQRTKDEGGILLFEVGTEREVGEASQLKPVRPGIWLTGRMVGIKGEAFDRIFPPAVPKSDEDFEQATEYNNMIAEIKAHQMSYMDKETFTRICGDAVKDGGMSNAENTD